MNNTILEIAKKGNFNLGFGINDRNQLRVHGSVDVTNKEGLGPLEFYCLVDTSLIEQASDPDAFILSELRAYLENAALQLKEVE